MYVRRKKPLINASTLADPAKIQKVYKTTTKMPEKVDKELSSELCRNHIVMQYIETEEIQLNNHG